MSESISESTPWHIWVVGIVGILWNAGGAMDYVMTQTQNAKYMSSFAPEQLAFFTAFPPGPWRPGLLRFGVVYSFNLIVTRRRRSPRRSR